MGGRRKICKGERKAGRRRGRESQWLFGGRLAVLVAQGGAGGRNDGGVGFL